LQQIGRRLGVSAERVRQIERRALAKLETAAIDGA
jgi:DNA-directed RNA polymerase sigma subunit (sigma70/sigma32)